jgi:hypothetical protein
MSCIGVKIDKVSRTISIMASLACVPVAASISTAYSDMSVIIRAENRMECSVDAAYTPISARVSRVCSLGKVDDSHELFHLADGNVFFLYDGKTFRVVKDGRIQK